MNKVGIPQGTRDFSASIVEKRLFILNTIRTVFQLYGFEPLETPAMENLSTLMGKYGEEGDKLLFKILNNGLNDPKNHDKAKRGFESLMEGKSTADLTERALRYDLTIPFARYVAMHHGQLTFPYKRYQMQPVWRADRPQKGRYREFTQCDADIVGSKSLINECELALIYHRVFTSLRMKNYSLQINHRKILYALAELTGDSNKLSDITVAIDKLDKIGWQKVSEELIEKQLSSEAINTIEKYLAIKGSNEEILIALKELLQNNMEGESGIEELSFLIRNLTTTNTRIDLSLARGLNYYTGTIFEVRAPQEVKIGSIGGGGRYDNLTGLFGVPDIPGVGISFGVDRIYDVMEELNLFPKNLTNRTDVLFFNLGEKESGASFQLMENLRNEGISAEMFHEAVKMDKQFKYAEKKQIPVVAIIGNNELEGDRVIIKNLATGKQEQITISESISYLKTLLKK